MGIRALNETLISITHPSAPLRVRALKVRYSRWLSKVIEPGGIRNQREMPILSLTALAFIKTIAIIEQFKLEFTIKRIKIKILEKKQIYFNIISVICICQRSSVGRAAHS